MEYSVEETECVSKDEIRLGEINVMRQNIRIDKSMGADAKNAALLHEIIHGVLFACGLDWQNENLTQSLATGLYQVLKDNPALLAFFGLLREGAPCGCFGRAACATVAQNL
jgi:hypothetical protein